MKVSHFFAYLRRMKYITRWSLMRNSERENIQEHSLEVAMVAHHLGILRNVYFDGTIDVNRLAVLAMYHDASEIFTGDMPTPVKYFTPELRELYGRVEVMAQEKLLSTLPLELRDAYREPLLGTDDDEYERLLKAADVLCAFMKCVAEQQAGNEEFAEAYTSTKNKLESMAMPEVNLFMERYIPSLGKSLDLLHSSQS